jgi:hypothetical protein
MSFDKVTTRIAPCQQPGGRERIASVALHIHDGKYADIATSNICSSLIAQHRITTRRRSLRRF